MQNKINWETKYTNEIARAEMARQEDNEGMARVCARRAAGAVIGEYLQRQAAELPRFSRIMASGASAMNSLKFFADHPKMPEEARERARHFTLQLQKDHTLPGNPDLIEDARWLRVNLLGKD